MSDNILDKLTDQELREMIISQNINLEELGSSTLKRLLDYEIYLICLGKGNLDFVAKVFENDGFELSGTSLFRDMTITTTPFEPVFASDIYSGILAGIKEMILNIQAGFTVSSGLNLKVSSDVDKKITNALSSEMTKQFASIKKAAEEEISKKLNESTGGALGKISDFNQIKTKLDGITKAADSIQEKIEAKKKEAEKLITGKIDSAVEDAKDKLKSNAKDSLKKALEKEGFDYE